MERWLLIALPRAAIGKASRDCGEHRSSQRCQLQIPHDGPRYYRPCIFLFIYIPFPFHDLILSYQGVPTLIGNLLKQTSGGTMAREFKLSETDDVALYCILALTLCSLEMHSHSDPSIFLDI